MWLYVPGISTSCPSTPEGGDLISAYEWLFPEFARCVTWKENLRPARSWSTTWKRVDWMRRLCGLIPVRSTAARGVASWISSLAVSRASRGVSPARGLARTTNGGSGRTLRDWFARYNPALSSWRTSRPSFMEDSNSYLETWPRAGSMRNGMCFALPMLVRRTCERGSSFWPTAVAQDDNKSPEAHMAMKQRMKGGPRHAPTSLAVVARMWPTAVVSQAGYAGGNGGTTLIDAATAWATPLKAEAERGRGVFQRGNPTLKGQAEMWVSPTAHDGRRPGPDVGSTQRGNLKRQAELWPTPLSRDYRSDDVEHKATHGSPPLSRLVARMAEPGDESLESAPTSRRRLNPLFVEWLMGWPEGWTSLDRPGSGFSETA